MDKLNLQKHSGVLHLHLNRADVLSIDTNSSPHVHVNMPTDASHERIHYLDLDFLKLIVRFVILYVVGGLTGIFLVIFMWVTIMGMFHSHWYRWLTAI